MMNHGKQFCLSRVTHAYKLWNPNHVNYLYLNYNMQLDARAQIETGFTTLFSSLLEAHSLRFSIPNEVSLFLE